MRIDEFYTAVGGNYEEVKSRLLTDARILKYLRKFPAADDFDNLRTAVADENWELAFRFSHNLKGVCLNLGLGSLYKPSSALCENLRPGAPQVPCAPMLAEIEEQYAETVGAIGALEG